MERVRGDGKVKGVGEGEEMECVRRWSVLKRTWGRGDWEGGRSWGGEIGRMRCFCLGSLLPSIAVLQELVWKCWEKEPDQRPAMGIVSDVLAKLLLRKGYPSRSPSFPTNLSKSAENLLAI